MKRDPKTWRAHLPVLAAAVLSLGVACAICACKNNPSTVAGTPASSAAPPVLQATPLAGDALAANPLTAPAWRFAAWTPLSAPLNDTRTTAPTRVACLFDAEHLYIACAGAEGGRDGVKPATAVALWLDTSAAQNGTEFFEIAADPQTPGDVALSAATWHRAAVPPAPKEDGSPNYAHQFMHMQGTKVLGLKVRAGGGTIDGQPAWTLVFAVPLKSLPAPLRATPKLGARWRMNVLRQDQFVDTTKARQDTLQANVSPVYLNAQGVMPYRMAELVLAPAVAGGASAAAK